MNRQVLNFSLVLLIVFAISPIASADGILRIPQDYGDDVIFPLECVDVSVVIHEQVAITTVKNGFYNEQDDTARASYHFRLPPAASVTGFGVWEGDKFVEYGLRPGEQGGPGGGVGGNEDLAEFLGANPFSIPLEAPPGYFAVQIRYAQLLPYDFENVEMMYPLCCGDWIADEIDTVNIEVSIEAQRGILGVTSNTYSEEASINLFNDFMADVDLNLENVNPQEDWVLTVRFNQEDIGAWLYTHRTDLDEPGFFMLVIEPGIIQEEEQVEKYFTFVLDRSGSMSGEKIMQARSAILCCFDHLLPTDHFNLMTFSYNVDELAEEMIPATQENILRARQFVRNIDANGGTNICDALTTAIEQEMGENAANQVIFATDGIPTAGPTRQPNEILQRVADANVQDARIYSFGVGGDVDEHFLAALSDQNRGISEIIDPEEAHIDEVVEEFYRYISTPALINPVVGYEEGLELDEVYPRDLQDLAAGKQIYIFGRYESFGEFDVTLSGYAPGGDTTLTFEDMEFAEEDTTGEFVPRMWAKSVIDYWILWMEINGEDREIIERIIELSIEYGILTPWTEYDPPENEVRQPVYASINAEAAPEGVLLSWTVTGVTESMIYNVYRSAAPNGSFVRVNDSPLFTASFMDTEAPRESALYYKIETVIDGKSYWSELIVVGEVPREIALSNPVPNPFNDQTQFSFRLPDAAAIDLAVYDTKGVLVDRIYAGRKPAGIHKMSVNGRKLPAGVYLLKLQAESKILTRKLVLVK